MFLETWSSLPLNSEDDLASCFTEKFKAICNLLQLPIQTFGLWPYLHLEVLHLCPQVNEWPRAPPFLLSICTVSTAFLGLSFLSLPYVSKAIFGNLRSLYNLKKSNFKIPQEAYFFIRLLAISSPLGRTWPRKARIDFSIDNCPLHSKNVSGHKIPDSYIAVYPWILRLTPVFWLCYSSTMHDTDNLCEVKPLPRFLTTVGY